MPVYSKKEFAQLCGWETKQLSVYIGRGKVIEKDGLVDDTVAENKYFLLKYGLVNKKEEPKESVIESIAKSSPKMAAIIERANKNSERNDIQIPKAPQDSEKYNLEVEKKSLDIEKAEQELIILKAKAAKLSGEVIPTELVKVVFGQHFKSFTISFQHAVDNLLMEIQKMKGLTREELATLRGKLIDEINLAAKEGIDSSKKEIKNIVREYSDKKGVGERD